MRPNPAVNAPVTRDLKPPVTAAAFAATANILLYVLLGYVHMRAQRNPDAPWVQRFYVRQFGPRTDTRAMTPRDHLRSSLVFLSWFVAFFAAWLLNAYTGPNVADASSLRLVINFVSALVALLWLAGAVWVAALGVVALVRQRK